MVRVRLPFNLVFNSAFRFYAAISIRSIDLFHRCMNNADIFLKDGYYKMYDYQAVQYIALNSISTASRMKDMISMSGWIQKLDIDDPEILQADIDDYEVEGPMTQGSLAFDNDKPGLARL